MTSKASSSKSSNSKTLTNQKWKNDEKVLCYYPEEELYYEAKIVDIHQKKGGPEYTVHYMGYNDGHDERITHSEALKRFKKYIPEEAEKAKKEKQAQKRNKTVEKRSSASLLDFDGSHCSTSAASKSSGFFIDNRTQERSRKEAANNVIDVDKLFLKSSKERVMDSLQDIQKKQKDLLENEKKNLENLQDQVQSLHQLNAIKLQQIFELEQRQAELNNKLEQSKVSLSYKEDEIEELKSKLIAEKIKNGESAVEKIELKVENNALKEDKQKHEQEFLSLQQSNDKQNRLISKLEQREKELNIELEQNKAALSEKEQELKEWKSKFEAETKSKKEVVDACLILQDHLNNKLGSDLRNVNEELKSENERMKTRLEEMRQEFHSLQQSHAELKQVMDRSDENFKNMIDAEKAKNEKLKAETEDLKVENEELKRQLDADKALKAQFRKLLGEDGGKFGNEDEPSAKRTRVDDSNGSS